MINILKNMRKCIEKKKAERKRKLQIKGQLETWKEKRLEIKNIIVKTENSIKS